MKKLKSFLTKDMEEKYIKFYEKFILQTKTLNDGGVVSSDE